MRLLSARAYSVILFLSIFLLACTPLRAQTAPPAGTTVAVKMLDAVDSSRDPAGKQYRASVTKAVNAGNGVMIPQGASAAVTLANSGNGSGFAAQLVSVNVNGQPVAVTSGPASVTAAAQSAAAGALSSMNSVLGGFGHHVNAPAAATAMATGQRVVLPPGVTLSFVLSQSPAANQAAPAAPTASVAQPAPAGQPMMASAAPAPNPASAPAAASSAGAGGPLTVMVFCFSTPPPNAGLSGATVYLSAAFEAPADTWGKSQQAFSGYMTANHLAGAGVNCLPLWTIHDAQAEQKNMAIRFPSRGNPKFVWSARSFSYQFS